MDEIDYEDGDTYQESNLYNEDYAEEIIENDEIDADEDTFMQGYNE